MTELPRRRRLRARALGTPCLLVFGFGLSPTAVHALPVPLRLSWSAPQECPSRAEAEAQLIALLRGRAGTAPASRVNVVIANREDAFVAELTISDEARDVRQLRATDCSSLSDAVLLIAAITLDPLAAATEVMDGRRREAAPAAPIGTAARDAASDRRQRLRIELGAQLAGDAGTLPDPSIGAGARVGVSFGRVQVQLEGTWWLPRVEWRGPRLGTGGEIGLLGGGARGCVDVLSASDTGFASCAALHLGRTSGRGVNFAGAKTDAGGLWGAASIGLRFRQHSVPLFVEIALDLGLCVLRPEYTIDGFGRVFQPGLVFGRASLGVGWSTR